MPPRFSCAFICWRRNGSRRKPLNLLQTRWALQHSSTPRYTKRKCFLNSLSFLFSLQFSNSKHFFFFFLFLFSLRFCRDVCVTKYRRNTKGGKSFFQLSKIFISSLNLVLLTYLLGFFFFFWVLVELCRIQMTISLSATVNEVLKSQNLSPICIFLARLVSNVEVTMQIYNELYFLS